MISGVVFMSLQIIVWFLFGFWTKASINFLSTWMFETQMTPFYFETWRGIGQTLNYFLFDANGFILGLTLLAASICLILIVAAKEDTII